MYCPKCKSEYREGFTICKDCNIELQKELPDEDIIERESYTEILHTVQKENIGLIKSILDAENIDYKVFDESIGNLYPIPGTNRVYVSKSDYEAAIDLLKDFI